MTAVIVGLGFIFLGAWGFFYWFQDFLTEFKGFGPISILIGGLITMVIGISSFRKPRTDESHKE